MRNNFPLTAVILAAITIPIISFFWRDNVIVTSSFVIIALVTIWMRKNRRDIILFMGAAAIGTLTETVCVYFGAWSYSNPTYIIPMWLPIGWGIAGLISGSIMDYMYPDLAMKEMHNTSLPWLSLAFFAFLAAFLSLFWRDEILVTVVLSFASLVSLLLWKHKKDMIRFVIGFFIGPATETICIYFGAWSYSSSFFLIPVWLFLAWALLNAYLGRFSDYIEYRRSSR